MAHITQEKKKKIALAIKALNLPKSWKTSLSIRDGMSRRISIVSAPVTVLTDYSPPAYHLERDPNFVATDASNLYVNEHHLGSTFSGKTLKVLERIMDAVKTAGDWFDRSDAMSDYSNAAFFIDLTFGSSTRECVLVGLDAENGGTVVPFPVQPRAIPTEGPSEELKREIARTEMIRRYKNAFAATPVGATLNAFALTALAEAALEVTVN